MRRDEAVLAAELDDYVRDLYDHVVRIAEDFDTAHDLISAALEAHLSVVSNSMNEVVLKVSAWAAIIALPTVIASIYGMNFVAHAGAALALRLPLCPGADAGQRHRALRVVQAAALALGRPRRAPRAGGLLCLLR